MENKRICKSCIYDDTIPGIKFNNLGICNYCEMIDDFKKEYSTGEASGYQKFDQIVNKIKENGKNKPYDCIIGVSGGTDSSYMLKVAKDYGLRPLAVHYDDTWNTGIASMNIYKVTKKLNIDLHTYVCDNQESADIFRSFFFCWSSPK